MTYKWLCHAEITAATFECYVLIEEYRLYSRDREHHEIR